MIWLACFWVANDGEYLNQERTMENIEILERIKVYTCTPEGCLFVTERIKKIIFRYLSVRANAIASISLLDINFLVAGIIMSSHICSVLRITREKTYPRNIKDIIGTDNVPTGSNVILLKEIFSQDQYLTDLSIKALEKAGLNVAAVVAIYEGDCQAEQEELMSRNIDCFSIFTKEEVDKWPKKEKHEESIA